MLTLAIPNVLFIASRCASALQCTFLTSWSRVWYISIRRAGWLPAACFRCCKLKPATAKSRWINRSCVLNDSKIVAWFLFFYFSKQPTCALQMEALQRIRVFHLFDVHSLLDCLHSLRSGGLQQVCLQLPFCLKVHQQSFCSRGTFWRKTNQILSNLILSHSVLGICWRRLCQGGDCGLCVGCYLASTGRQTEWRWYLSPPVHHSQSYPRLFLHLHP